MKMLFRSHMVMKKNQKNTRKLEILLPFNILNILMVILLAFNLNIKKLATQENLAIEGKRISEKPIEIEKYSNISIILKNKNFLNIDFSNASQQTVDELFQNLKKVESFTPTEYRNSIKWSLKRPLPLKLYKKKSTKEKDSETSKRIQQAYSYLKKKDFMSFHTIISDIILRHHYSLSAAQAAFLASWSLMIRDPKNPYRYFEKATHFFDYIISAHRYTKYSDGALMLLIPWLMKKDLKTAQILLEKYINLEGKIEKIDWNEELDIEEEGDDIFISKKKSRKITSLFFDSIITMAQIEQQNLHQAKQNWKKRRSLKKIRQYLHYLQQFFKKKQQ